MTTPTRPVRPAMPPVTPGVCDSGTTPCGEPAVLFANGWKCPAHTPAAMAGRPEAPTPDRKDTQ